MSVEPVTESEVESKTEEADEDGSESGGLWKNIRSSAIIGLISFPFAYVDTAGLTDFGVVSNQLLHGDQFGIVYTYLNAALNWAPQVAFHPLIDPFIDVPVMLFSIIAGLFTMTVDWLIGAVFRVLVIVGIVYYYTLPLQLIVAGCYSVIEYRS